ncbi:hypothetical protein BUALT_Bualt03G0151100 [Buddleja alternifolia]|uniref:Uncharacterized protein n=1 Tax=Buddleja alternifolia TaxID=168488 RepID=A0AAV6Y0R7_9LAMI|nr:hypothetical protein BUALT_Bualt03G0151100 [Buddleja alternifolia]
MIIHQCSHEIAGLVTEVGSKVTKEKVGDAWPDHVVHARTVPMICPKMVLTYSYGGYSDIMVCDEHFIICWPEHMPLDAGCPLLCAGITTYSPMKYFGLDKTGIHLGVVGLGGLGHVAVKFAKAFGAKAAANTMDGILDTVSAHRKLIILGVIPKPLELPVFPLLSGLCGKPVTDTCPGNEVTLNPKKTGDHDEEDTFITSGFYISLWLGFVFGFLGICGSLLLNKSWRHKIFKVDSVHHWLY